MKSSIYSVVMVVFTLLAVNLGATTIITDYGEDNGEGAWDRTPVAPLPDNPGRTLGEQRRFAHDYVAKLTERIVWIPDNKPVINEVSWKTLANISNRVAAVAYPVFWITMDDDLGFEVYRPYWLAIVEGIPTDREEGAFRVEYDKYRDFTLGLQPSVGKTLVATGLHEHIHLLGFVSASPVAEAKEDREVAIYDLHVRLAGDSTPVHQMTESQLSALRTTQTDARWLGTATSAAAGRLLTAGHDMGAVYLHSDDQPSSTLSHLSHEVVPRSIMSPTGARTLELGIVAYMLSDLGWGPVVDSEVAVSAAGQTVTATVTTDAAVENLVVNLALPSGVSSINQVSSPATCATSRQAVTCTYARLSGTGLIAYDLAGPAGSYTVEVDVEHRAAHVDPSPANNFATTSVAITGGSGQSITLSKASIQAGQPAGTRVGTLAVRNAAQGVTHTFSLATGGRHNACFRIEGADLLTARQLDSAPTALNVKVAARASSGFILAQDFTIDVTAASMAAAWAWTTAAHAQGGRVPASGDIKGLFLALAVACLLAAGTVRGRRRLGKPARAALALAALLAMASCGGSDSPASPPVSPPPVFSC